VDPAKFSHALCEEMSQEFARQHRITTTTTSDEKANDLPSPRDLLKAAYSNLKTYGDEYAGSSTACVAVASSETGVINIANLGDSGYFVFRQGRVYRRSHAQTHQFNTPFQLSIVPQHILSRRPDKRPISDDPYHADVTRHQLQHGDVVVLATDGLTDNVFAQDILKLVTSEMVSSSSWYINDTNQQIECSGTMHGAEYIAKNLVKIGSNASLDPNGLSPFTLRLRQDMGIVAPGGKPDDITVVVMLVEDVGYEPKDKMLYKL